MAVFLLFLMELTGKCLVVTVYLFLVTVLRIFARRNVST